MAISESSLTDRLAKHARRSAMPGAALAVLADGVITEAAYGVINRRTNVAASPDTVFQLGSITKVFTATLAMQLVDEGLLDLDRPVRAYLPEFEVSDGDVTDHVTPRHLLSHTSGIDGDIFVDTGNDADCLARYLAACRTADQLHPLGATMSYCNTGLIVVGRLIEVLRGEAWDVVVRHHLLTPLGMHTAGTRPEEALLQRTAVGHNRIGHRMEPVARWGLFRSIAPVGLVHASARDALIFAQLHLRDGTAPDGRQVLSPNSAQQMRTPHVDVPEPFSLADRWGLGWSLMRWGNTDVYGHNGSTIGQSAFLRVVPDADVAVCLLTNGGHTGDGGLTQQFFHDVFSDIVGELAGVAPAPTLRPAAQAPEIDLEQYAGRYARYGFELELRVADERSLHGTVRSWGDMAAALRQPARAEIEMVPVERDVFVARSRAGGPWIPVASFELPHQSRYLHMGARATPRVG